MSFLDKAKKAAGLSSKAWQTSAAKRAELRSSGADEQPIFKSNYAGFWVKVYRNRIDFKAGVGRQSIPISQIASVQQAMVGKMQVTLETTGGKKYKLPTLQKKELQKAIYDAQTAATQPVAASPDSAADEIAKLAALKEKGLITEEEFVAKKKQLLQ